MISVSKIDFLNPNLKNIQELKNKFICSRILIFAMSYDIPIEIRNFLEVLKRDKNNKNYQDILSYPSLVEDVYYTEMTRDYALVDWNNSPEDINLINNYRNLCEKHRSILEKKNIVFEKLVRLMSTF